MPLAARMLASLRDPRTRSELKILTSEEAIFADGNRYPCSHGCPILIDEGTSVFSIADVLDKTATTQQHAYRNPRQLKNFIRRRVLPGLTWDRRRVARHELLGELARGQPVLVIGAGDRGDEYRARFPDSDVVLSDVHVQFGVELVFDAHSIPFADRTFGLVVADQVLEHTIRPWVVAAELQRVTRVGGFVHIEVPFAFPLHGAPYDLFRFTPIGLRFLFAASKVRDVGVTEGRFSSAAVYLSTGVIESFAGRAARRAAVAGTRLAFGWIKYLDALGDANQFASPKGLFSTFEVDGTARTDLEMLEETRAFLTS